MENNKKVLLFHVGREKEQKIRALCSACGIQSCVIGKEKYEESLGAVAGIIGMKQTNNLYRGADFPTEMMVFSGIDSQSLDVFLAKYREAGIAPVSLKAVLTPYNVHWNARQLYKELLKEQAAFTRGEFE